MNVKFNSGDFKKGIYQGFGFKKGHTPWNKSKKIPYKARPTMKGRIAWSKGKKFSEVYKEKIANGKTGKCKGEKHWNWQGGKTKKYRHTDTQTLRYKKWRMKVFERDNWTCQTCSIRSGVGEPVYLEPHHIKSWTYFPELRYDINNGITLCRRCHKLIHSNNQLLRIK